MGAVRAFIVQREHCVVQRQPVLAAAAGVVVAIHFLVCAASLSSDQSNHSQAPWSTSGREAGVYWMPRCLATVLRHIREVSQEFDQTKSHPVLQIS